MPKIMHLIVSESVSFYRVPLQDNIVVITCGLGTLHEALPKSVIGATRNRTPKTETSQSLRQLRALASTHSCIKHQPEPGTLDFAIKTIKPGSFLISGMLSLKFMDGILDLKHASHS